VGEVRDQAGRDSVLPDIVARIEMPEWGRGRVALVAVILGYTLMDRAMGLSPLAAFGLIHALRLALARHLARLPMGWFQTCRSGAAKRLIVDEPERLEPVVARSARRRLVACDLDCGDGLALCGRRADGAGPDQSDAGFFPARGAATARLRPMVTEDQRQSEGMNGATVEYLAGMPVVRIFNRIGAALSGIACAVSDNAAAETAMGRRFVLLGAAFSTLVVANIVVMLPAGKQLRQAARIDLPIVCFFVILGANYGRSPPKLFSLFCHMAHMSMASPVIVEVLETPEQPGTGAYQVLRGLSLTAPLGSITALVGPAGSGKSTVASLVPRLYDRGAGGVTPGGYDLRET